MTTSFNYQCVKAVDAQGLPFVLERSFSIEKAHAERCLTTSVNFSPLLNNPFRELEEMLSECRVDIRHSILGQHSGSAYGRGSMAKMAVKPVPVGQAWQFSHFVASFNSCRNGLDESKDGPLHLCALFWQT